MRKGWLIILGLLVVLAFLMDRVGLIRPLEPTSRPPALPQRQPPQPPLPGEEILTGYAQPGTRPQDDLTQLSHAFSNLSLLIKGSDPFRMGANEEFAAALRGQNRHHLRFLPDTHPCFNAQGQIVDRWQTPLFFHVTDPTRIDLRSAGPDRQMWTADDLHRRYDGQFLPTSVLNPPSLDSAGQR